MGVRFSRTAQIERGKRDEALAFAAEVSDYVEEHFGVAVTWGMQIGSTFGTVWWYSDYSDLSHFEEVMGRTMVDEGYNKLLDSVADVFGRTEDTIVYTM